MERLTGWKRILLIIVAVYVVIALPLVVLDQLHIFSVSQIFQPYFHTYVQVTKLKSHSNGDPFLYPVKPSGSPFSILKVIGTVATIEQKDGKTYLSVKKPDNEQVKEVMPIANDADISIVQNENGKSTIRKNVSPTEIKVGDRVTVTYHLDAASKSGTISSIYISR